MSEPKAYQTELWGIDRIIPYEQNTKIHDEGKVEKLVRSIEEHGLDQPVVVDEKGVIIKGHGRRLAVKKLEWKQVPVVVRDDLTEEQKRAARIADNLVARGEMDEEMMDKELSFLAAAHVDIDTLGLNEDEMEVFAVMFEDEDYDLDLDDDLGDPSRPESPEEFQEASDPVGPSETEEDEEYEPSYSVVVTCENEGDQETVYNKMTEEGYTCKILSM